MQREHQVSCRIAPIPLRSFARFLEVWNDLTESNVKVAPGPKVAPWTEVKKRKRGHEVMNQRAAAFAHLSVSSSIACASARTCVARATVSAGTAEATNFLPK